MNILDSLKTDFAVPAPQQRDRAWELMSETLSRYKFLKGKITKEQSINLICTIGHREYDVYNMQAFNNDFVSVKCKTSDGNEYTTFAPVEQVSLTIVVENKRSETPPREIGFDAIWREYEKSK
jgi:hypothetical protein